MDIDETAMEAWVDISAKLHVPLDKIRDLDESSEPLQELARATMIPAQHSKESVIRWIEAHHVDM
jgi:hypothetical protein